jgi:hypothetical protein
VHFLWSHRKPNTVGWLAVFEEWSECLRLLVSSGLRLLLMGMESPWERIARC